MRNLNQLNMNPFVLEQGTETLSLSPPRLTLAQQLTFKASLPTIAHL